MLNLSWHSACDGGGCGGKSLYSWSVFRNSKHSGSSSVCDPLTDRVWLAFVSCHGYHCTFLVAGYVQPCFHGSHIHEARCGDGL